MSVADTGTYLPVANFNCSDNGKKLIIRLSISGGSASISTADPPDSGSSAP